jgi:uncharacterized membrane protein
MGFLDWLLVLCLICVFYLLNRVADQNRRLDNLEHRLAVLLNRLLKTEQATLKSAESNGDATHPSAMAPASGANEAKPAETTRPGLVTPSIEPDISPPSAVQPVAVSEITQNEPAAIIPPWGQLPAPASSAINLSQFRNSTVEPKGGASFEQMLTAHWLVWIGGIAFAMGGLFLVRMAIDAGFFGPTMRMISAASVGILLISGSEILRVRGTVRPVWQFQPDQISSALAASGFSILFLAIYAAYWLHQLLDPVTAFILMGATSLAAIAASGRNGTFCALLGITGAMLVPALVSSEAPSVTILWLWLGISGTAAFAAALLIRRPAVAYVTAAGWFLWCWATFFISSDTLFCSAIILLQCLILHLVSWRLRQMELNGSTLATSACISAALLLVILTLLVEQTGLIPYAAAAIFVVFTVLAARTWPEPLSLVGSMYPAVLIIAFAGYDSHPDRDRFIAAVALLGLTWLTLSVAGRRRSPEESWGVLSALLSLITVGGLYIAAPDQLSKVQWAGMALVVAILEVVAAADRLRQRVAADTDIQARVLAVWLAVVMALFILLEGVWLTIAIAALAPAAAAILLHVPVPALRLILTATALIVTQRLFLNPDIVHYPVTDPLHWVLWGFGLPAGLFLLTERILLLAKEPSGGPGLLSSAAQRAGFRVLGLLLLVSLVTLEIQLWSQGSLQARPFGLLDTSLRTILWLGSAVALIRNAPAGSLEFRLGTVLAAMAITQIVVIQMLIANPLLSQETVGGWPVINLLLIAYAAPIPLLFLLQKCPLVPPIQTYLLRPLCLLLLFTLISMQVRQWFHGADLRLSKGTTEMEIYTYSAAWILLAFALLAAAILRRSPTLRIASLIIVLPSILKVFLVDLDDVTGWLRVLSFFSLGGALIGIGLIYRRWVFTTPANPPDASTQNAEPSLG